MDYPEEELQEVRRQMKESLFPRRPFLVDENDYTLEELRAREKRALEQLDSLFL